MNKIIPFSVRHSGYFIIIISSNFSYFCFWREKIKYMDLKNCVVTKALTWFCNDIVRSEPWRSSGVCSLTNRWNWNSSKKKSKFYQWRRRVGRTPRQGLPPTCNSYDESPATSLGMLWRNCYCYSFNRKTTQSLNTGLWCFLIKMNMGIVCGIKNYGCGWAFLTNCFKKDNHFNFNQLIVSFLENVEETPELMLDCDGYTLFNVALEGVH